jgi:hypothetical protein
MAAMVGRGKSWLWWLTGCLCALVFGPGVRAGELPPPKPVYGMPVPPPDNRPANDAEKQKQAEGLLNEILAPVPAPEPPAPVKAEIEKLIKDFASDDAKIRDAASEAVVKLGVPALGALREATKSKDAEVAERSKAAIAGIEAAAKAPKIEELKKLELVGRMAVQQRLNAANLAAADAEQAAAAADKSGDAAAAEKARATAKAERERAATLAGLVRKVGPGLPMMKYGVVRRLETE